MTLECQRHHFRQLVQIVPLYSSPSRPNYDPLLNPFAGFSTPAISFLILRCFCLGASYSMGEASCLDTQVRSPSRFLRSVSPESSETFTLNGFFFASSLRYLWQLGYVHGLHFLSEHDNSRSTYRWRNWSCFTMGLLTSNMRLETTGFLTLSRAYR
jgi:hypothetical protein